MDYRTFGHSEGDLRQDNDFVRHVHDFQDAITFLQSQSEMDPARIGIWGIGHCGSPAITLSAIDPRIKTVVLHLPTTSGMIDESNWPAGLAERLRESRIKTVESGKLHTPQYETQIRQLKKRARKSSSKCLNLEILQRDPKAV